MRQYLHWTDSEINYLKNNYFSASCEEIQKNLRNRKRGTISHMAKKLGLCKQSSRLSKPEKLLQQTPEAYYWIGFLLADGGFTERRINLKISDKDINHLKKYQKFIESTNKIRYKPGVCQLRVTAVNAVKELRKRFDIVNHKTHHPCKIDHIVDDNLLFALIVGFFDGDGSLSKIASCINSFRFYVVGYHAWLSNFEYMEDNIRRIVGSKAKRSAKIRTNFNKPGSLVPGKYRIASFYISDQHTLLAIFRKAEELKLPFMERKLGKLRILAAKVKDGDHSYGNHFKKENFMI